MRQGLTGIKKQTSTHEGLAGNSTETHGNESARGWWDRRKVECSANYPDPSQGMQGDRVMAPGFHSRRV